MKELDFRLILQMDSLSEPQCKARLLTGLPASPLPSIEVFSPQSVKTHFFNM